MLRAAIHPLKNQIIVDCTKHRFSTKTQCDLGRFAKLMRRSSHKDSKLYVASTDIANQIINSISKYRNASVPFIEFNPGPCVLTRQIIRQMPASRLVLVEENAEFQQSQKELCQSQSIPVDSIQAYWNYNFVADRVLKHCNAKHWHEDVVAQVFTCLVRPRKLYYMIISNAISQNGFFKKGRVEYFATMYSQEYLNLIGRPSDDRLFTSCLCLFQIMFECELLEKLPPDGFAPIWRPKKPGELAIKDDPNYIYLVRITPRKNLFTLCNKKSLPKLAFFLKQCLSTRQSRISTIINSWLPNFLMSLALEPPTNRPPTEHLPVLDQKNLEGYLPAIDVTTEAGKLTPVQLLAIFNKFQKTPGYDTSSFQQQFVKFQEKRDAPFKRDKYKMAKPKDKKGNTEVICIVDVANAAK